MILFLARFMFDVLGFLGFVHRRIAHELVVLLLCLGLRSAGLGLKACKIRLNDLNHTNNTSILRAHALVWLVENFWLLHEGCCLCSFSIKILKHTEGLSNSCLCILGILDGDSIFCFFLFTDTGGLCHCSI